MAKFLRTNGISFKIEEIIIGAREQLVIVSPYLKISNNLYERLKEKSDEGVRIDFIYGKSELSSAERSKIDTLESINLYYYEKLHAKCYYNEHEMIITSMNLYEFSEKNNREMGVLITKSDDVTLFNDAIQETKSILLAATQVYSKQSKLQVKTAEKEVIQVSIAEPQVSHEQIILEPFNSDEIGDIMVTEINGKYPNHPFEYNPNGNYIRCNSFIIKEVNLIIGTGDNMWRIDVRIDSSDYKTRKKIYDVLASMYKYDIEAKFPAGVVNWGGQMKRIKLDIYKKDYPNLFISNPMAVEYALYYLKLIETEIVERIKKISLSVAGRS